jgi:hypothetical protein
MKWDEYRDLIGKYRELKQQHNSLVKAIRNIKKIVSDDKFQQIEITMTDGWDRDGYRESSQAIYVNAKNVLRFYESELPFHEHALKILKNRIDNGVIDD